MIRKIIKIIESSNFIRNKIISVSPNFLNPLLYIFINLYIHISRIIAYRKINNIDKYLNWKYNNPDRPYKEFYSQHVTSRMNPKEAVGGIWEIMGKFQFNFLVRNGLKSYHKLLDIGCGCLRGGVQFIQYLNKGNYYGIDLSARLLQEGRLILSEAGLEHKSPVLSVNIDLKFDDFRGEVFDYLFAHSVFTHMPLNDIKECFQNIHKVMNSKTKFLATFRDGGNDLYTPDYLTFFYPFDVIRSIGNNHNCDVTLIKDINHPKGQKMMKITLDEY